LKADQPNFSKGDAMSTHPPQRFVCAVVALVGLLFACPLAAQEHALRYDRQRPVGSVYDIHVQAQMNRHQVQSANGQVLMSQDAAISVTLAGTGRVLATHDDLTVQSMVLDLSSFEAEIDGQPVTLDTEQNLTVTQGEEQTTFVYEDGSVPSPAAMDVLKLVKSFLINDKPQNPQGNEIFDLLAPKEVGATWSGDAELIAQSLSSESGLLIDAEDIGSQFSFLGLGEFAGQESAVFNLVVSIEGFTLPNAQQQGIQITQSQGTMTTSGLLPLDPASGDAVINKQMALGFTAQVAMNGQAIQLDIAVQAEGNAEFRAIDPALE